ncbi:hypothetical protein LCGC14_1718040 [marine sediment metagenome]|uniref:Uncharacterized protein n=1 Tax=marine sediment metagenome TaxID=412755 RepID=A0A0F9I0X6_9ZZZZ
MFRFLKHIVIFLALIWVVITLGVGYEFDKICIEGRLSAEQAVMINDTAWGWCPVNRLGMLCEAAEGDRVLAGECSEFFKFLWRPNKWWPAIKVWKFPWQYNKTSPLF